MFVLFYYSQITFRRAELFLGQLFSKLFTVYTRHLVSVFASLHTSPNAHIMTVFTPAQRPKAEARCKLYQSLTLNTEAALWAIKDWSLVSPWSHSPEKLWTTDTQAGLTSGLSPGRLPAPVAGWAEETRGETSPGQGAAYNGRPGRCGHQPKTTPDPALLYMTPGHALGEHKPHWEGAETTNAGWETSHHHDAAPPSSLSTR